MAGEDTSKGGLAGRYATALLDLAEADKALDGTAAELRRLRALLAESADLRRLFTSPLYAREQQIKALRAVLERAGFSSLVQRFVLVVAENRRLFALGAMLEAFLAELARRRGEAVAEVASARALEEDEVAALKTTLDRALGGKVELRVKVDPALLGGLTVKVGSRLIDASISSQLRRVKFAMKEVG